MAFYVGYPIKIREKGDSQKYYSKTLKWHNVLINKMLLHKHRRQNTNLLQTFLLLKKIVWHRKAFVATEEI